MMASMQSPVINVHLPKKGVEVTTVTKHDPAGRILEFEKYEVDRSIN